MSVDPQYPPCPLQSDILKWCEDPNREVISVRGQNPEVIRKNFFAVKHGRVSPQEAQNQREASRLVDPELVKVPHVFDFFENDTDGYLVMQYVKSRPDIDYHDRNTINMIADALNHLHSFTSESLGPIAKGEWKGILWDDAQPPQNLESRADLAEFVNGRLFKPSNNIEILECDLTLTHLDAAPRNVKITETNIVCLLDWSSAGFFPSFFEISALHLNTGENSRDAKYCHLLAGVLIRQQGLDSVQLCGIKSMVKFVGNSVAYSL
jgi:aminoglycoside phosphotransferase